MKTLVWVFGLILLPALASAAPKVACPAYIADLRTGTVIKARGNHECYATKANARKNGFIVETPAGSTITFSGTSDVATTTFRINRIPARFNFTYSGNGNFYVWIYRASDDDRRDLLVNEIGSFTREARFYEKGTFYLDVTADAGSWSVDITQ